MCRLDRITSRVDQLAQLQDFVRNKVDVDSSRELEAHTANFAECQRNGLATE